VIEIAARFIDGAWEVYGTVSDVDDAVEGDMVVFGGDLGAYFLGVEVQADGTFASRQTSSDQISGIVSAQTKDLNGLGSNVAQYYIDA
jgi:hypothetical protein